MKRKDNAFYRWLFGEKDALQGRVEMRPQAEYETEETDLECRRRFSI